MKKLKFFKAFLLMNCNPTNGVNNWIVKNKNELSGYRFLTAYSETGYSGESIGNEIDLVYTTKNNKPIPPTKEYK